MGLYHNTVGSGCDGAFCQGCNIGADSSGVAGIYDNRQMGFGTDHRNSADVEGVSGGSLVGADAALTEDNIRISLSHDVLCGIEPFVDGGSHTSL